MPGIGFPVTRGGFPIVGSGAPSTTINPATGGTFTRSTEGARIFGAATDGSTAFLDWPGVDVRRIEDRGDGLGPMFLTEGSQTSYLLRSTDYANAAWTAVGLTATSNANNAPDAAATGAQLAFTASATAQISQPVTALPADNLVSTFAVWLRAAAPQTVRLFLRQKDGATEGAAVSCSVTTVWQRFSLSQSVGAGASAPLVIIRNHTDAAARNVFAWHATFEQLPFPTSTIRTTAAAATRGADSLIYAVGQFPAGIESRGFTTMMAPDFTSAELTTSGANMYSLTSQVGAIFVLYNPTGHAIGTYDDTTTLKTSLVPTYSRAQGLAVTVNPPGGALTVAGATTGNGTGSTTAWAWSSSPVRIGARYDGIAPFYGRIGSLVGL